MSEVKEWIAKNLLKQCKGVDNPYHIPVIVQKSIQSLSAPLPLQNIPNLVPVGFSMFSGIYFLVDKNEVVYVGQSYGVSSRVGSHYDKIFDSAYAIPVEKQFLDHVEAAFIRTLRPKYNGKSSKGKMYAPTTPIEHDTTILEKIGAIQEPNYEI